MNELDEEFFPLPSYTWEARPSTIPLEIEEAATALYISDGEVKTAATRLKVPPLKLQRLIDRSPRLTRLHKQLVALLNDDAYREIRAAFQDSDSRRREWASSKVITSRQFQEHPLAPNAQISQPTFNVAGPSRIVISWDDSPEPPTIEHDPS